MPATIFSPEQLDVLVKNTLPEDARPGEKIIVGTVDQEGVQVVVGFRKGFGASGSWDLEAAARHEWDGSNSVGAKILLRW